MWHAADLHFGCKAVDLWNVCLVVMLGECHTSIQIILIDQLKNCGEDTGVASRHVVNVISVPHDQSLKNREKFPNACNNVQKMQEPYNMIMLDSI